MLRLLCCDDSDDDDANADCDAAEYDGYDDAAVGHDDSHDRDRKHKFIMCLLAALCKSLYNNPQYLFLLYQNPL